RKAALRRAAVFEVRWRSEIEQARTKSTDHVERDALFWRKLLLEAPNDHEKATIRSIIGDTAQEMVEAAARRAGFIDVREPGFDELPEHATAGRYIAIATSKLV